MREGDFQHRAHFVGGSGAYDGCGHALGSASVLGISGQIIGGAQHMAGAKSAFKRGKSVVCHGPGPPHGQALRVIAKMPVAFELSKPRSSAVEPGNGSRVMNSKNDPGTLRINAWPSMSRKTRSTMSAR